MDIISFNEAATANGRIEKFIENPDSTSGVVTVPKVIASGETITIPAGRVAILPNVQIDGVLNIENGGEVFIPSGATFGGVVEKVTSTDNAIVRFDGTTGKVQNSSVLVDDAGNVLAKDLSYKNSLITINSWSYSGTTITLNVTSHTFIAGDYIEVTGLTSTTKPANGIFVVTSVTTGTIVFTAYAAPTGTAGVSTARVNGFTTVNGKLPLLITAGANTSLSGTGYDKLPSGVIIQWGAYTSSPSADSNITFPIAFPTAAQIVLGMVQGNPSQGLIASLGATGKSLTSFYMGSWSSNSARVSTPTFWIAIGY